MSPLRLKFCLAHDEKKERWEHWKNHRWQIRVTHMVTNAQSKFLGVNCIIRNEVLNLFLSWTRWSTWVRFGLAAQPRWQTQWKMPPEIFQVNCSTGSRVFESFDKLANSEKRHAETLIKASRCQKRQETHVQGTKCQMQWVRLLHMTLCSKALRNTDQKAGPDVKGIERHWSIVQRHWQTLANKLDRVLKVLRDTQGTCHLLALAQVWWPSDGLTVCLTWNTGYRMRLHAMNSIRFLCPQHSADLSMLIDLLG